MIYRAETKKERIAFVTREVDLLRSRVAAAASTGIDETESENWLRHYEKELACLQRRKP